MEFILMMSGFAACAFVQNAAFTAVSRSRNSGDVLHHARWAIASNGIWFVMQIFIWSSIWTAIEAGTYWQILVAFLVYVAFTTLGSVMMMARMLATEKDRQRVGAR